MPEPRKPRPMSPEYLDRLEANAQLLWAVTVESGRMLWLIEMARKQLEMEARGET